MRSNNYGFSPFILCLLIPIIFWQCAEEPEPLPIYPLGAPVRLDFAGPATSETAADNPFLNYRLDVTFTQGDYTVQVPGYYAADGQAAESSAEAGNVWRVLFTPEQAGEWRYSVSFRQGEQIAISEDISAGEGVAFDGEEGRFLIDSINNASDHFVSSGFLRSSSDRYLRFSDGRIFLKGGANSPENLLAYEDFDGTYHIDSTKTSLKKFEPHVQDWRHDNPTWQNEKGKGLIGALNYLASEQMNAVYFITLNIEGDGQDVFPYRSHEDFTRFDCSKLDQWEIVFSYAQKLGIVLHLLTQETENELMLDGGDTGPMRRLYYRELLARFGHHPALLWDLGEENGPANFTPQGQNDEQRRAMAQWFAEHDPYAHPVILHTHAYYTFQDTILTPLLGFTPLDGLSLQVDDVYRVYDDVTKWLEKSTAAGHTWAIGMDEIGWWWKGAMDDGTDPRHDTLRTEVLWPALMAGAYGVEWYFGYEFPHNDLEAEDWRSRDALWDQTRHALAFFRELENLADCRPHPELIDNETTLCLASPGDTYVLYLKKAADIQLDLSAAPADRSYHLRWYNPRTGEWSDATESVAGGQMATVSPPNTEGDWAALVKTVEE